MRGEEEQSEIAESVEWVQLSGAGRLDLGKCYHPISSTTTRKSHLLFSSQLAGQQNYLLSHQVDFAFVFFSRTILYYGMSRMVTESQEYTARPQWAAHKKGRRQTQKTTTFIGNGIVVMFETFSVLFHTLVQSTHYIHSVYLYINVYMKPQKGTPAITRFLWYLSNQCQHKEWERERGKNVVQACNHLICIIIIIFISIGWAPDRSEGPERHGWDVALKSVPIKLNKSDIFMLTITGLAFCLNK